MKITSTAFAQNQSIPSRYSCDGEDINPPLHIEDVPASAKSLVLIMDDPDVPAAAKVPVWDHWIVFNIPPTVTKIEEGENPEGVLGSNTRGKMVYGGPCPPDREHRYFFRLFALDTILSLPLGAARRAIEEAMKGHIVEYTELMGRYERS
jgi:hypothetical protein